MARSACDRLWPSKWCGIARVVTPAILRFSTLLSISLNYVLLGDYVRVAKTELVKIYLVIGLAAFFFQFAILQVWRQLLPLVNGNPWFVAGGILVFLVIWYQAIGKELETARPSEFFLKPKDLFMGGLALMAGILCWQIWVHPFLGREWDVCGDELSHFLLSQRAEAYIRHFFSRYPPREMLSGSLRYPDLMVLPSVFFANAYLHNTLSMSAQRISLLVPFLLFLPLVYAAVVSELKDGPIAFLFALTVATSPLLLCYTMDKYLDIGHPILFFLAALSLLNLEKHSERRDWVVAMSAGLLSLVRDNGAPTTLLIAILLGMKYIFFMKPPRARTALLMAFTGAGPFLVFFVCKTLNTRVDMDRLGIGNIPLQNYGGFFSHTIYYLPLAGLLFGVLAFFSRAAARRWAALILLGSLAGQFSLYALFQFGWMPWSRNYLMFYSQILVLGILGVQEVLERFPSSKPLVSFGLLAALGFQLYLDTTQLNRNIIFHEIQMNFPYSKIAEFIAASPEIPKHASFVVNGMVEIPRQLLKDGTRAKDIQFRQTFSWEDKAVIPFREFRKSLTPASEWIMFQWREPRDAIPISRITRINRPSPKELTDFEVLNEFFDPRSDQTSGILLLHRKFAS